MTWRLFLAQLAGVTLILGLATWFLFSEPLRGRAEAGERVCGEASYYGTESGSTTANGEHFTGRDLTAASRTLPFNTRVRVTYVGTKAHPGTGKSVVVRINDRGPALWTGRVIDLSKAAAVAIGLVHAGHGKVCLERL